MANHSHAGHMPSSGRGLTISAWLTGVYLFFFVTLQIETACLDESGTEGIDVTHFGTATEPETD